MEHSKVINTDYYVISEDFRLLDFNKNVKERYKGIQCGDLCYQVTMKRDTPCPHCPIAGNSENACPVYYDPFYRDWVQAVFTQIDEGKYAVTCYQTGEDAAGIFQRLKIEEVPIVGNLPKEYDSENIGIIGAYCEEDLPLYYVSENMVKMLGYDSAKDFEEGIEGKVINTIFPDDLPQVMADLGEAYYAGMKYETTYRMPRKDGTWFWIIDRGEVIEVEDGRLMMLCVCLDVTREHELQELRKRESDASASRDRIFSDIIRALYSYNATVNLKTGKYTLSVGTGMEEFIHQFSQTDDYVDACDLLLSNVLPEYVDEMNQKFSLASLRRQQNQRGHIGQMVYSAVTAEGIGWFEVNVFMGVDDNGTPIASVFGRDVTEAHDRADTQAQLEIAKAANEAKSAFLFSMSHDIRTPMNAILGFASLMEKEIEHPDKLKDYLGKIKVSGDSLLHIINNVLEISHLESGKEVLNETVMDLLDDALQVTPLFENEIEAKNLTLTYDMDIVHRYIYADLSKVRNITMNLISNAIKYTPGGGRIHMHFQEYPSEKEGYAVFVNTISDTGIGMSREFQERIFETFTREYDTTQSKVSGMGLGMSIVKKYVDLMGGKIEVTSEPGKGSSFKVTLEHRIAKEKKNRSSNELVVDLHGKRILLAEDNELNAEIAIAILEDAGVEMEWAIDGKACIEMLQAKEAGYYDLILMDIQMPRVNGYEATKQIRAMADSRKAAIPIIAMTANAFEEDRQNALAAGMNGHLAKPIEIQKLMEALFVSLKNE